MSITVATAGVAPSAPSSVAAPAAPSAGAGSLAFLKLLETFSSAATAAADDSVPPAARPWPGAPLRGTMPAGVAGALDAAKGGTVRTGTEAPLEADGRTPQPAGGSDQTATLGSVLMVQVLPLPMPAPLAAPASLGDGSATVPASGASIATTATPSDRRPSATGPAATDGARNATGVDGSAAARTDVHGSVQAPGFGVQAPADQTNPIVRVVTTSSLLTAAGVSPGEIAGVPPGASVRLAAATAAGAAVEASNVPSPQVAVAPTDLQNGTISGLPGGGRGSARLPVDENAQTDHFTDSSRAASMPTANGAAESRRPGSSGSSIDAQTEASPTGEPATRKLASSTPADHDRPHSTDLSAQPAVSPRDQPPPSLSPAATPAENPSGVAADRRSAAGVRLAAALARGARAEGPPGAGPGHMANRVTAQATTTLVDSDPQNVATAGRVDVNAQADRLGERIRTEPLTFGAAVSPLEQVPVRVGTAESGDLRSDVTLSAEPATEIKASGLAALFAAPTGVLGVGASSGHAIAAAVATTAQPALDPAVESDLPRQIVQAMRLQWKDGIGDARIRLLPEHLGALNVAIRVEHGSVTAALEASTPAVRHWIESHEPMLRQSLAEQGLHLDRLIVLDEPEQTTPNQHRERRREKGEESQQQQQRQSRRRSPADDTTFEVIV